MLDIDREATILLYHGVTASASNGIENFSGKHVEADLFERHMATIVKNANVMTLREMATRLAAGESLPARSVAVTFDDTFKNNSEVALPILQKHGVPATFFVTTGFVGTRRRFWVDRVEHAVNMASNDQLPSPLSDDERLFVLDSDKARIAAVVEIKKAMKLMSPQERDQVLESLVASAAVEDDGSDVANYQNMNWDDVRALDQPPYYEVGGHSVNHEILAYLSPSELETEVATCLGDLERELGHPVDLFSYPEGQAHHYSDAVIETLKRYGVVISPSAIDGGNSAGMDPFHLRRTMVGFMGVPFPFVEAV